MQDSSEMLLEFFFGDRRGRELTSEQPGAKIHQRGCRDVIHHGRSTWQTFEG